MPDIFLDFETRSRCDLGRAGLDRYAQDPTTDVLCMAYSVDGEEPKLWYRGQPQPEPVKKGCDSGWTFHAFNAPFEIAIFSLLKRRHGWSSPSLDRWRCTQARAGHANLPLSLGGASDALSLGELGKDSEGRKAMLKTCKPYRGKDFIEELDDPDLFITLYEYCKKDVIAEFEIDRRTPDWPEDEVRVWQLNTKINQRGVPVDLDFCSGAVDLFQRNVERASADLARLTYGAITSGSQRARILDFVNSLGVNIGDLQKETVEKALATELPSGARAALTVRQSVSSAAAAKYSCALDMQVEGRVHGQFQYYGASTGRFAGRSLQVHNLKRQAPDEAIIDAVTARDEDLLRILTEKSTIGVLGDNVRGIIRAPHGATLVISDYGQIEARALHWLALDQGALDGFREQDSGTGADVYQKMAARIFGGDPVDQQGDKRQTGKTVVLGAGYGMGAQRYRDYAANFGLRISPHEAEKIVKAYRGAYPLVPQLWRDYEQAAIRAVGEGKTSAVGPVVFMPSGDWMTIRLPSGRCLYYHRPELTEGKYGPQFAYMRRGQRERLWGGVFAENVTQAVSRDFLTDAMLRIDQAGLDIVLHVHDEVVCECGLDETVDAVATVREIMNSPPEWAPDIPLKAEPAASVRFTK